jgi:hypothetical protein
MADIIVDDGLLVAYADNQLDSEQRKLVEKTLQSSESLRLKLNKFNTSGAILRANLDVGQEVIPDHIRHRILMLDQQIKKERLGPPSESKDIIRITGFLELPTFFSILSDSNSLIGKVCYSNSSIVPTVGHLKRITNIEEQFTVVQNDNEIQNFGSIVRNDRFNIVWESHLDGDLYIYEIIDDYDKNLLFSSRVSAGSFIDMPPLIVVSDKAELQLEVEVKNANEVSIYTEEIRLEVVSVQDSGSKDQ